MMGETACIQSVRICTYMRIDHDGLRRLRQAAQLGGALEIRKGQCLSDPGRLARMLGSSRSVFAVSLFGNTDFKNRYSTY